MTARGFAQWLWSSRGIPARVARGLLLPAALAYRTVMVARAGAYRHGWLRRRSLPLPAVAIGNLAVGGTGKTPLAAWVASFFARRGVRPGILLRGYGGDEEHVHRRLVPGAIVVAHADRAAAAARAHAAGAEVLVLDDAYQRLDVARDVDVALIAAETARAVAWPLPAGPWREDFGALRRANVIIVTRRQASASDALRLAARIADRFPRAVVASAHLAVSGLEELQSGRSVELALMNGKRVVVAAGIADPVSFAQQVRASGGARVVELLAYQDHHPYPPSDVARLAQAAKDADYVVVTEKDAVKLRDRWPADAPEPLVAGLALRWELNGDAVERVLEGMLKRRV